MPTFTVLTVSRRQGWEKQAAASITSQTIGKSEWIIVAEKPIELAYVKAPPATRKSNLNASLNTGLELVDTDYVIFYQDFIDLPPDCFEKLLDLATPTTFVTTATINTNGQHDGRYMGLDCVRPCQAEEWEANVAIAPMAIIRELGGFDEEYDAGWSWDNVNLAERAELLGCTFLLDETNCPQLLEHDKSNIEPNGEFHVQRMREIKAGERPLKVDYLNG